MKLRNKLLPLASCLALGATVAPISLTSCANSGFVSLMDDYLPTITKADGSSYDYELTEEDALSVYVNAINENPQRFIDDVNWTYSLSLNTIAVNPYESEYWDDYIIPDGLNSTLDYAKQKISNVKMGKTTFLEPDEEGKEWVETTVPTLSFDLEREQKFTFITSTIVSSAEVETKIEGITRNTLTVSNLPIIFNSSFVSFVEISEDMAPQMHLGRYLTNADLCPRIFSLIPSYWSLTIDKASLVYMLDPWSVSFTSTIDDKYTTTYGDTTETSSSTESYEGTVTEIKKFFELDDNIAEQLVNWRIKSYYLSDIAVKEEEPER